MKDIKRLLRYVLPYKWRAIANIVCNLLGAFFSLFSLSLMIPFLGVLFGTLPLVDRCPEFQFDLDAVTGIIYYNISEIIRESGRGWALFVVIAFVSFNALLKNLLSRFVEFSADPVGDCPRYSKRAFS